MLHVIYNKFILTKILHSLPRATELKWLLLVCTFLNSLKGLKHIAVFYQMNPLGLSGHLVTVCSITWRSGILLLCTAELQWDKLWADFPLNYISFQIKRFYVLIIIIRLHVSRIYFSVFRFFMSLKYVFFIFYILISIFMLVLHFLRCFLLLFMTFAFEGLVQCININIRTSLFFIFQHHFFFFFLYFGLCDCPPAQSSKKVSW